MALARTTFAFGFLIGTCALAALATPLVAQRSPQLAKPVRLKAGGEIIDTGKHIAHAGPLLCDYDGDGKQDLLVGNFKGHIQVYRNVGTNTRPKLEDKGLLQGDGKVIRVHNW